MPLRKGRKIKALSSIVGEGLECGGSGRHCQFWDRAECRLKAMAEPRPECAVVDRTANLQQKVGVTSRPAHLLRLVYASIDQEVGGAFGHRRSHTQSGSVPFGVINEPRTLAAQIIVDLA